MKAKLSKEEARKMLVKGIGKVSGGCLAVFLLTFFLSALNAIAIMSLWNWFISPTLDVQRMPFWGAYGVYWIANLFLSDIRVYLFNLQSSKDIKNNDVRMLIISIIIPLITLFIGWVLHFFV